MPAFDATPSAQGLYDPVHDRDSCGIGLVVDLNGQHAPHVARHGLTMLANLKHRGARAYDGMTGDGAGMLLGIPHTFFAAELATQGAVLPAPGQYGVGCLFLPPEATEAREATTAINTEAANAGFTVVAWRRVPTKSDCLGDAAKQVEPAVWQLFLTPETKLGTIDATHLEKSLFLLRKRLEVAAPTAYVVSLSTTTVVYKGMLLPDKLGEYYPDLTDGRLATQVAVVHSRFSTNTFPSWRLAQPFRYLCHNGEINTIRGNIAWMRARAGELGTAIGLGGAAAPTLIAGQQSDSASLDNAAEALHIAGLPLAEAMLTLVPDAWEKNPSLPADQLPLRQYQDAAMEPWDGPAALVFCDGRTAGVVLDRNGLRPCRYLISTDGLMIAASEAGALPIPFAKVQKSGRIGPGQAMLVDLATAEIAFDQDVKARLVHTAVLGGGRAAREDWCHHQLTDLTALRRSVPRSLPAPKFRSAPSSPSAYGSISWRAAQAAFGLTQEEIRLVLTPMAVGGEESVSSMGDDTAPAVLAQGPRSLFDYFRQQFAQVTNPPIDPLREDLVMSLTSYLGPRPPVAPLLLPNPGEGQQDQRRRLLRLKSPLLSDAELSDIRSASLVADTGVGTADISLLFAASGGAKAFAAALARTVAQAEAEARRGASILILSDRGIANDLAPLPILLAISAVHHRLLDVGLRTKVGLIAETGAARSVHHCACLIGFGANAINPYLALATVSRLGHAGAECLEAGREALGYGAGDPASETMRANYLKAINKGLKKILSKLGIATLTSYCGAQTFEALGIGPELIAAYFPGTTSPIGGLNMAELAAEALVAHARIAVAESPLPLGGQVHYRQQGERHGWTPEAITHLQHATRLKNREEFRKFTAAVDGQGQPPLALRHLLHPRSGLTPLALERVEGAADIVRRFTTGAMSLGAIGKEAHETLAIAMNQLGAKSNSGEGGEDPLRFGTAPSGLSRSSAIKQVASGRFGVTIHYLNNAQELQIKIAQGAKPGEGGQLPGAKVDDEIARLRHSTAGVQLISPPPHHDIYSIEDLAQLIFDLKNANPRARISVKLVAQSGIGAVAVGVAKAGADKIVVSGDGGGTGASPLSSIQHAGMPWEIGLAETHQALLVNGLRARVHLETDGQLRTGRDVVIAALLGAEEFGFATAPLVVEGCIMMRKCHLNICPVGIATQDPELRARFSGTPEAVINYFFFVADEVREYLSRLGLESLRAAVGRTDLLAVRPPVSGAKTSGLDLSPLLHRPKAPEATQPRVAKLKLTATTAAKAKPRPYRAPPFDRRLLRQCLPVISGAREKLVLRRKVTCHERATGTLLASAVASQLGAAGLPKDTVTIQCSGYGGQSFGAFLAPGLTLILHGIANDYVGKGLSGGRIVIHSPLGRQNAQEEEESAVLAGNTLLYGATSGQLFVAGTVGERFAVRNSGATAVVEGTGDHGCEYMTGGVVLVLGRTGRNFAAGMSGGQAYVLDADGSFASRCNQDMVELQRPSREPGGRDALLIKELLAQHLAATGSARARRMLNDWPRTLDLMIKVMPKDLIKLATADHIKRSASVVARREGMGHV